MRFFFSSIFHTTALDLPLFKLCFIHTTLVGWLFAIHMKDPFQRLSTLARVGGAGFRVLGRLDHRRSVHYERFFSMWTKLRLPFELWLGRGRPLSPYWKGILVDLIFKETPGVTSYSRGDV